MDRSCVLSAAMMIPVRDSSMWKVFPRMRGTRLSYICQNEPQLLERDAAEFEQWIALAKKYLELPEFLSWSEHAMYIGRKP